MADEQSASSLSFAELLDSVSNGMALAVRPAQPPVSNLTQTAEECAGQECVDLEILRATLRNLSASVEGLFVDSHSKLKLQSEREIDQRVADMKQNLKEERECNEQLRMELQDTREQLRLERLRNEATMEEYRRCAERMSEQSELSRNMLDFRISSAKKDFVERYTDNVLYPRAQQHRLRKLFWFWRLRYLREWKHNSDAQWEGRLERTTKQVVLSYEEKLGQLREQLRRAHGEREQLKDNQSKVAKSMKEAFLRSVAALNREALSLSTQELTSKLNSCVPPDCDVLEP